MSDVDKREGREQAGRCCCCCPVSALVLDVSTAGRWCGCCCVVVVDVNEDFDGLFVALGEKEGFVVYV